MQLELAAFSIVILLFSVIVHEVMHGVAALKFGDHTAENAGRLTLNPIPHIDPFGTILIPGILILSGSPILFGWAKPVPVNPLHFSNIKKGELVVSSAGILANLGLAITAGIIFHLLGSFSPQLLAGGFLIQLIIYTVTINLMLAVFNLIPVPPLDGSKILMSLLPFSQAQQYQQIEKYGPFILLALLILPAPGHSVINIILSNVVTVGESLIFGF